MDTNQYVNIEDVFFAKYRRTLKYLMDADSETFDLYSPSNDQLELANYKGIEIATIALALFKIKIESIKSSYEGSIYSAEILNNTFTTIDNAFTWLLTNVYNEASDNNSFAGLPHKIEWFMLKISDYSLEINRTIQNEILTFPFYTLYCYFYYPANLVAKLIYEGIDKESFIAEITENYVAFKLVLQIKEAYLNLKL